MPAALILSLATLLACGDKDADDSGEPGDGGTTDGGTSDGGTSDGGTTDGGTTDGGTTDGGTTDGGTTDGGTSEYGSGTVTITDLVDPTGVFSASWEVRSAGWHMSTDPLELWIIDAEAGTIELIGDVALDPLSLNSHAADPCLGFEALLEAGAAESDPAARTQDYFEAQRLLVTEAAAVLPLFHPVRSYRVRPWLSGLTVDPFNFLTLSGLEVAP